MSLLKKLAGETAIYGISYILARMLNYLFLTPYLTRAFEKTEYGVVSDLYALSGFLIILFTFRLETGFFRFGAKKENRQEAFTATSNFLLLSTPILVGLLMIFSQPIANLLAYPNHSEYIIWFAAILGLDSLAAIPFARLRLESKPIHFAVVKLANVAVNIIVLLFFISLCPYLLENGHDWVNQIYSPEIGVGYVFIANLAASAVTLLLLLPQYKAFKLEWKGTLLKKIIPYVAPLVVVGFAGIVNEMLDRQLLKWLLPGSIADNLAELGVYSANYKLAMMMTIMIQAFNYAAEPFFFRNVDRNDARHLYGKVGQAFAIVGSFAFVAIMMYLSIIHPLFVGPDFREGVMIIPILLMANLFLGLYYNFAIWFKLSDRTTIGMYIAIGGALVTIIINIIFIPQYGYMASAWATLVCYILMSGAAYLTGQRYYPIHYPIKRMLLYMIMALGCYGLSFFIKEWTDISHAWLLLINTLILLMFAVAIYAVEKDHLISFIKKTDEA